MTRIELGIDKRTGQEAWAELRDPEDISQKDRKRVRALIPVTVGMDGTPDMSARVHFDFVDDMGAATIVAAIETWWQSDVPVAVEAVEALPARMYDLLVEATEEHTKIVNFRPGGETSSESRTGSKPTDEQARRRPRGRSKPSGT